MSDVKYSEEKILKPANGLIALVIIIAILLVSIAAMIMGGILMDEYDNFVLGVPSLVCGIIVCIASCVAFGGLKIVNPNEALVLSLFGKYYGTIYENGFWYVNPFSSAIYPQAKVAEAKNTRLQAYNNKKSQAEVSASEAALASARKVSTKVCTFVNGNQKVNDKLGNPVEVSAIVIWKVVNATKAVLNVDYYKEYLSNQTDSTIRNVARLYPYDIIDDNDDEKDDINEKTLRGSATIIAEEMKKELEVKVADAGIEIVEVRLNQIAYAPEIAAAMLQRQQAIAVIAARKKIVEGAVSMVEMALDKLKEDDVVDLDEERKAQMVSNLLVVLCSSKEANPILNAGSIYLWLRRNKYLSAYRKSSSMNSLDGRRMILDLLMDKSNTFLLTVSEKEGRKNSAKITKKMQVTKRLHLFILTKKKGIHVTYIGSHLFYHS